MKLFEKLAVDAVQWRKDGYPCTDYPLIGEVLRYQFVGDADGGDDDTAARRPLRYLRDAQFRALEVYWFVRLHCKTPHILDLYQHYYGDDLAAFCQAISVPMTTGELSFATTENVIQKIKEDDVFVKTKRIDAVREALTLDYPSYILALAMGAGKTVLIGAIVATEFAMALAYRRHTGGDVRFMQNALVFAPGKTILHSLREIEEMPFAEILPPTLLRDFMTNLKITYAQDGTKELPGQVGGVYNLIVTNTEKIRLRANTRRNANLNELQYREKEKQDEIIANLRLQKIASLPNLGVFSDEAHHVYGTKVNDNLKRTRETVNYIHEKTPLVAVINTTGTPYGSGQPLREVVFWYGLQEGIHDGILKSLHNGIHNYETAETGSEAEHSIVANVIDTFFKEYGNTCLPNGAKAKIAFYFRNHEHLEAMQPAIEQTMTAIGEDTAQVLVCTSNSPVTVREQFNRINRPACPYRVVLLVGIGTEGWNCPSLFACALLRAESTSNSVFVLQAATRCLRQTAGNTQTAKIFLTPKNAALLDKELQNSFATNLSQLDNAAPSTEIKVRIRKVESLPKLEITRTQKRVVRKDGGKDKKLPHLRCPTTAKKTTDIVAYIMSPTNWDGRGSVFTPTDQTRRIPAAGLATDCYAAATRLAANYHLPLLPLLQQLKKLYPKGVIPQNHLTALLTQIEAQTAGYETTEERITEVLALIHTHDADGTALFEQDADGVLTHRLRYSDSTYQRITRDGLLREYSENDDPHDVSFHYSPYNLDSAPEGDFLDKMLNVLKVDKREVKAFLFTGGMTDARKTDFHFEYKGVDGRYYRYFPDFVLVKNSGEFYVIEIKAENEHDDETVKRKAKAVERESRLNPDKFRHKVVYCGGSVVSTAEIQELRDWIE